jgi:energy-converting hydrogenase Eha subunit B
VHCLSLLLMRAAAERQPVAHRGGGLALGVVGGRLDGGYYGAAVVCNPDR